MGLSLGSWYGVSRVLIGGLTGLIVDIWSRRCCYPVVEKCDIAATDLVLKRRSVPTVNALLKCSLYFLVFLIGSWSVRVVLIAAQLVQGQPQLFELIDAMHIVLVVEVTGAGNLVRVNLIPAIVYNHILRHLRIELRLRILLDWCLVLFHLFDQTLIAKICRHIRYQKLRVNALKHLRRVIIGEAF